MCTREVQVRVFMTVSYNQYAIVILVLRGYRCASSPKTDITVIEKYSKLVNWRVTVEVPSIKYT